MPDQEGQAINRVAVPTGLAASIEFFLLAAAARASRDGWLPEGYKHLSHTSHRIDQHTIVAAHIERHLRHIRVQLRDDIAAATMSLMPAHAELRRTAPDAPTLDVLIRLIPEAIRQMEVIRVNSETEIPSYGPRLNFLIGGNILGRGLTIDDLLVTYYIREAQVSQMDTVWQHARMYGYRQPLMPYTRVYLPRRVAARFKGIHESEEKLRALLEREAAGEFVPITVMRGMRASRPNAIESNVVQVIAAGLAQIFPWFLMDNREIAAQVFEILQQANVPLDEPRREARTTQVPLDRLQELIEIIPVRDDDLGRWDPTVISTIVESYRDRYNGMGPVYARALDSEQDPDGWQHGRLSGEEIRIIQRAAGGVPALALMYSGTADAPTGWYPTLVQPPGSPAYVFNPL